MMQIKFLSTCVAVAGLVLSANGALIPQLEGYSVYTSGNFTGFNSDIHDGSLVAGGNVTLTNYRVADGSLISGGTVDLTRGTYKDIYAKNGIVNSSATINGSQTIGGPSPLDFAAINDQLSNLSDAFSGTTSNITSTSEWGGGAIRLSGINDLNVFTIDASDLKNLGGLFIDVDEDEKVLINVTNTTGTVAGFRDGFNMVINNSYDENVRRSLADRILFNFTEATTELKLNGTFFGTFLAMGADIEGKDGNLNGGLFAKSYSGSQQFHINSFDVPVTNVPEPATVSMMILGVVCLLGISRKKFVNKK
ncbi:MAG TPA: choice-of-anchor A family protein [Chitinispirillaceae bacterium]|nr:choice-of-anchor A family protein [Chitinispirillaceae bacterium]